MVFRFYVSTLLLISLSACNDTIQNERRISGLDSSLPDFDVGTQREVADTYVIDLFLTPLSDVGVEPSVPDLAGLPLDNQSDGSLVSDDSVTWIAVGHKFSEMIGVPGQSVSLFTLGDNGRLSMARTRLVVDHPVGVIRFFRGEDKLLVGEERGRFSIVDLSAQPPVILDPDPLDAAGIVSAVAGHEDSLALVNRDSSEGGGVYWINADAAGMPNFLRMPLVQAVTPCQDQIHWVLVGGQTLFEPIRDEDIHMVSMVDSMPRIISSGDVLDGVFEAGSVAVNAQCDFALFVNRSPYSDTFGELFLVDFSGGEPELVDRIDTEQDIGEIVYVEKYDLFVAASFESETLTSYRINDHGVVELGRLSNQGLIAGFSVISSTSSADIVLVSTHARDGSRIGLTEVNAEGQFSATQWRSLGEGFDNIPSALTTSYSQ